MADRLDELRRERGDLKLQGRFREMIPVQVAIVAEAEKAGLVPELAGAWNYLSALYHQVREYNEAEHAARKAIEVFAGRTPGAETLACYQFKLAQILAARRQFSEAVPMAEAALLNWGVFHDPPDDFLKARQDDVALMRACAARSAG